MRNLIISAGTLASVLASGAVYAQENTTTSSTNANVGVSLPGANQPAATTTTTTTTTATVGTSDHDQMVGRLAVGYFGIATAGAGAATGTGSGDSPYAITGPAPVVGVRYWLTPMIGIDAGIGLSVVGGTLDDGVAGTPDVDRQSFTAFLIHGGVPLALASSDHFTFEVIPELNVGFAGGGFDPNGAAAGDVSYSGFHFDIGARVGAEINFGFIKLPQLSLVATVGLRFDSDSGSTDNSTPAAPAPSIESSSSRSELHTTVGSNPWSIFTDNIAALYYF